MGCKCSRHLEKPQLTVLNNAEFYKACTQSVKDQHLSEPINIHYVGMLDPLQI